MRTKIINGIKHTHTHDYRTAPINTRIEHLLIDAADFRTKTITHMEMNTIEKDDRNRRLRQNGIHTQFWQPALYIDPAPKPHTKKEKTDMIKSKLINTGSAANPAWEYADHTNIPTQRPPGMIPDEANRECEAGSEPRRESSPAAAAEASTPTSETATMTKWRNQIDLDIIENNFTYHAPNPDKNQIVRYGFLRLKTKHLATHYIHECPPSRERAIAITKLEEAVFWANAAIARNE